MKCFSGGILTGTGGAKLFGHNSICLKNSIPCNSKNPAKTKNLRDNISYTLYQNKFLK